MARLCGLILLVGVAWYVVGWIIPVAAFGEPSSAGEAGDAFGGANALFSALALGFLIATLWMQRTELRLQREEFALQREQLALSATAQQQSERAFRQQVQALLMGARMQTAASLSDLCRDMDEAKAVDANRSSTSRHYRDRLRVLLDEADSLYASLDQQYLP